VEGGVAQAITVKHLVIGEEKSALHGPDALAGRVDGVHAAFAKLAAHEMGDEGPPLIPVHTRLVLLHHLFEFVRQVEPVALEAVGIL